MKMLVLIFSYFFTISVFSNEIDDVVSVISKINTGRLIEVPQLQCLASLVMSSDAKKVSRSELYNKCAIDLCGPSNKNTSVWITNDNFLPSASKNLLTKIDAQNSVLNKVFDKAVKTKLNEVQVIKDFLESETKNTAILVKSLSQNEKELLDSLIFDQYLKKEVYRNEPPEKRLQVKINPPANASKEFIKALNDYAKNLQESIVFDPNSDYFKNIYSEKDLAQIASSALEKVKKISRNNSNSSLAIKSEIMLYEKNLSMPNLSKVEYESTLRSMRELDKKLSINKQSAAFNKPVCDISECHKIYSDFFNNPLLTKKISDYENILKSPATKTQAIAKCKAQIIVSETKRSDMKKAQEVFLTARKNIIKNVLPRFSSHSRSIMLNYLNNNLEFTSTNLRRSPNTPDAIKAFSTTAQDYLQTKPLLEQESKSRIIEKIFILENSYNEINPLDQVEPCAMGAAPSNAWDVYLPTKLLADAPPELKALTKGFKAKDHVTISDFSCQHADHGKHNTAHEIGHGLNYLFLTTKLSESSAAIYNKIRACSTNTYLDNVMVDGQKNHEDDRVHTEEDTADLIAFMSDPTDKKIYSCQFLEPSMTSDSYANLKFTEEFDTPHSTGFSRMILEAVNKKPSLPESCLNVINEEKPQMRFNKCI